MFPSVTFFGYTLDLYDFFNFFGWVVLIVYNFLLLGKKKYLLSAISNKIIAKAQNSKTVITWCAVVETFTISCVQFFSGVLLNKWWGILVSGGRDNYYGFGLWAPIVLVLFCGLFRIPALKQLDLYTPAYALSLISFKIACFCAGCCRGIAWESGIFNPVYDRCEFPIQLLEGVVAVGLFIYVHLHNRKKHATGSTFPMYLIFYSGTRFFTEFLRGDFPVLVGPLTTYHFQCAAAVAIGCLELYFVKHHAYKFAWLGADHSAQATKTKKAKGRKC